MRISQNDFIRRDKQDYENNYQDVYRNSQLINQAMEELHKHNPKVPKPVYDGGDGEAYLGSGGINYDRLVGSLIRSYSIQPDFIGDIKQEAIVKCCLPGGSFDKWVKNLGSENDPHWQGQGQNYNSFSVGHRTRIIAKTFLKFVRFAVFAKKKESKEGLDDPSRHLHNSNQLEASPEDGYMFADNSQNANSHVDNNEQKAAIQKVVAGFTPVEKEIYKAMYTDNTKDSMSTTGAIPLAVIARQLNLTYSQARRIANIVTKKLQDGLQIYNPFPKKVTSAQDLEDEEDYEGYDGFDNFVDSSLAPVSAPAPKPAKSKRTPKASVKPIERAETSPEQYKADVNAAYAEEEQRTKDFDEEWNSPWE